MVTAGVAGARGTTLGSVVDVVDVVVDVLVEVVVGVVVDVVVIGAGDEGAAVTGGGPTPGSRSDS
jgi:hypothetical protein